MASYGRWLVAAAIVVSVSAAIQGVRAQQNEVTNNFKYSSGQDVQPVFEGWTRNADGSFAMHFGYFNRNWVEELAMPVGPNNSIEPGGPDRGQPTFFQTRTNRNLFTVTVPKDWGKKELVWTLIANGKTQKSYAWLQPEWEIDLAGGASTGGRQDAEFVKNKPPTVSVKAATAVTLPQTLALTANVTDDGLPKPAPPRQPAIGQETPAILQGGVDAPVNVPQVAGPPRGQRPTGPLGPTVTFMVWRGPAGVVFNPKTGPVKDGQVQSTATFTKAGEYTIRVRATDRILTVEQDVKVTVSAAR